MKVSFDWDGCLRDNDSVKAIANAFIIANCDVYVLTSRIDDVVNRKEILAYCKEIGIQKDRILFTPNAYKVIMFKHHNIDMHFDDDHIEVDMINEEFPKRPAILIGFESRFMQHWFTQTLNDY
jgi:uncharacterized HAD superfamily protein